jgi:hypothetical protein
VPRNTVGAPPASGYRCTAPSGAPDLQAAAVERVGRHAAEPGVDRLAHRKRGRVDQPGVRRRVADDQRRASA